MAFVAVAVIVVVDDDDIVAVAFNDRAFSLCPSCSLPLPHCSGSLVNFASVLGWGGGRVIALRYCRAHCKMKVVTIVCEVFVAQGFLTISGGFLSYGAV